MFGILNSCDCESTVAQLASYIQTSMALRWGICSAGKISHDFVVGLKSLPETEHQVVAVAARSLESASKFAKNHSIPRYYGSYQELANDTEVLMLNTVLPVVVLSVSKCRYCTIIFA